MEQTIKIELKVTNRKDALFLHKEIGQGKYGEKDVRLLLTNNAIIVQSVNADKKEEQTRDNFIITLPELSEKLIKALVK